MTYMEKKIIVRLCAKILLETDLYDTDIEVRNLIDWICVSEQIKANNNEIRKLTGEYKRIELKCREGAGLLHQDRNRKRAADPSAGLCGGGKRAGADGRVSDGGADGGEVESAF